MHEGMKRCGDCKQWFPETTEHFYANNGKLFAYCKGCARIRNKRQYEKRKADYARKKQQYYLEHREERIAYQRAYKARRKAERQAAQQ